MRRPRGGKVVSVRLNIEEFLTLEALAKESHQGLSTWVKNQIFHGSNLETINNQKEILRRFHVLSHMFVQVFQELTPNVINEKTVNDLIEDSKKKYPVIQSMVEASK